MELYFRSSVLRLWCRFWLAALLALFLAACAATPEPSSEVDSADEKSYVSDDSPETRLDEPRENELVVVINYNAITGNHTGLFIGKRLSDPAGSYKNVRSRMAGWKRPNLNDYVGVQMTDGKRIHSYRFTLPAPELAVISSRLPEADAAMPLFCGSAVNNVIEGIGPFARISRVAWTTPAAVAEKLDLIIRNNPGVGKCVLPDGSGC